MVPVSIRIGSVVVNRADIELLTRFWSDALGLTSGPPPPTVASSGCWAATGSTCRCRSPDTPVSARDQMHLDLYTDDQAGEVRRLIDLGARHVRDNHDPDDDYVVLADPEGNPFCVCAA